MTQAAEIQDAPRMTVREFLAWDDGTDARYELIDGRPVAMTPPMLAHAAIVGAAAGQLHPKLRPPCRLFVEAGIRVTDREDIYYQADLAVQCEPNTNPRWLDAPMLIVEVLSPSTAGHDRGRKGFDYRGIPSVREVLFLFTSAVRAEIWRRTGDRWVIEDLIGREAVLRLDSVDLALPLGAIYGTIPLEPDEPSAGRSLSDLPAPG
jgi:Uma2 family endonuclease